MDQLSERACYINSMELCKTPEKSRIDADESVSPVLGRSKKYYRTGKRDSKVHLDKGRFTSSSVPDENNSADKALSSAAKVEIARVVQISPEGKCSPEPNVSSKFKSDILSKIYEGFKTATGKNLSVSEGKVRQQANKVFGDILNTTPAPIDQNLLSKSDSAAKRSFLTRVNVVTNANDVDGKSACGDRTSAANVNLSDQDIFTNLPSTEFCRGNRATEVYSNTNYNELSTDSDTLTSDKNVAVKKLFDINEISDSQLVYLADTAEYLSAQHSGHKSRVNSRNKKVANDETLPDVKKMELDKTSPQKKLKSRHQTTASKHDHKSHSKRARIKQALSKNVVDPTLSQSNLDINSPALAKNIYELHRNTKFTDESEHRVSDKSRPTDNSILSNLMKMFGVNLKTAPQGFAQAELGISREVFDRHSKVLEAVVHTMQADEQLQQKKLLKKVKHHAKVKNQRSSQKDKDSTKRKLEDRCVSPVEVKEEQPAIAQENKRSRITTKKTSGNGLAITAEKGKCLVKKIIEENTPSPPQSNDVATIESEYPTDEIISSNPVSPTNKKLQIEIGSTNIKININSISLTEPHIGFRSASGRDINITPMALEAANNIYKSVEREIEATKAIETIPEEEEEVPPTVTNYCGLDCPSDSDSISTVNDYIKQTINDCKLSDRDAKDLAKFNRAAEPVVLGFSSASGNKINVSIKSMHVAQAMYREAIENDKEIKFDLLNSPDGESVDKKVAVMFSVASEEGKSNKLNNLESKFALGFSTARGGKIDVNEDKIKSAKRLFDDIECNDINLDGDMSCFSTAAGKKIGALEAGLQSANKLLDIDVKMTIASETSLKSARQLIGDAVSSMDTALIKLSSIKPRLKLSASKKRLGMTSAKCKPVTISKHSLEKAKSFFDDTEDLADIDPDLSTSLLRAISSNRSTFGQISPKQVCNLNSRSYQNSNSSAKSSRASSPIKTTRGAMKSLSPTRAQPVAAFRNTSPIRALNIALAEATKDVSPTRIKQINNLIETESSISSRNSSPRRVGNTRVNVSTPAKVDAQQNSSFHNLNITPIKPNPRPRSVSNRVNLSTIQESPSVLLMEQSSSDLTQIKADLDEECELLKMKLHILNDRKSALDLQESIMSTSTDDYKKPQPGILYLLKQRSNRVPLKDLQLCSGENVEYFNVDSTILDFTFNVADQVHFNAASEIGASTIKTKDGAIIVPSVNDSIGLTEISRGFRTMPAVDPDIIPKGWIANHFKMIVWKLASYERIFPHYFKNSLCLENVVQQLKYRYDREIDRTERSAIRRITEKDDVPQKRMVLCVADIHEISKNTFELDLIDGWYLIRTRIDQPLCRQVIAGKIRAGIKLMIQNAELINCDDGAHPLQLPDHVRLRINMNTTRRSPWHLKLGYQKQTRPLPIRISTMHLDGGQIAFVKVYINRVYPMRYLEHNGTAKVWRNLKAEQKRAEECERETCSRVEVIQERILRDDSQRNRKSNNAKVSNAELSTITCSEQLHDLLECCNDPESFVEKLSASQRTSLMAYMQTSNLKKQEEVLAKITEEVHAQKTMDRNVTGVLRLLVTDVFDKITDGVILSIWRPTEDILDSLTEDCVVSVFNIAPNRIRNELSSTPRTYFKVAERDCQKNNRQIVPIAMTVDSYYKPAFNEMDTVGLVVQSHVDKHRQELWLCDFQGRLLLVQIHDGPKYCCLLDNITRGDCVTLLNVLVHKPHKGYGQCVANQLSVVSTYPQIKSHRENLDMFKQRLPNDVKRLLADCDIKIEKYRISAEIKDDRGFLSSKMVVHTSFDDYVDEQAFNSSGLTADDVALSMLQIDPE